MLSSVVSDSVVSDKVTVCITSRFSSIYEFDIYMYMSLVKRLLFDVFKHTFFRHWDGL